MEKTQIFVYGTLRDGGRLHYALEAPGVEFVGPDSVKGRIFSNNDSYPTMDIEAEGTVHGEIYMIPIDTVLRHLDSIEGYHPSRGDDCLFFRKTVTTHGGREVQLYTMGPMLRSRSTSMLWIQSGDWMEYIKQVETECNQKYGRFLLLYEREEPERRAAVRKAKRAKAKK